MLCMTEDNRVISVSEIAAGDAGSIFIDIDDIVKRAMAEKAKKVIIAHNHTSRYMKYSLDDFQTTEKLCAYFSKAGITLMEHFVVNKESYHGILYDLADTDNWKARGF
jgi:DNA repair protein RadC